MISRKLLILLASAGLVTVVGCSSQSTGRAAVTGGLLGGAIGAGTGAAIGGAISNGDVAASALLGTGIGVPVGALIAVAYVVNQQEDILAANAETIRQNQIELARTQREIEEERSAIEEETRAINPDRNRAQYEYLGVSAGNPYR